MYRIEHLPIDSINITSGFGMRKLMSMWWHNGIDLRATIGTPVYAVSDGVVMEAKDNPTGYGLYVALYHDDFGSLYAHLSELLVEKGQQVKAGDIVGYSGNTGASTGPHLHFEIRLCGQSKFWDRCEPDRQVFMHCTDPTPFIDNMIERENLNADGAEKLLLEKIGLEQKTIDYIRKCYRYGDDLTVKLARAII